MAASASRENGRNVVRVFGSPSLSLHLAFMTIPTVRIVVGITGASGAVYAQRLLDVLDASHEVHVVVSNYAPSVIAEELPEGLKLKPGVVSHNVRSMNAPFASGSNAFDAMVIVPCSMGTLGRIAHG